MDQGIIQKITKKVARQFPEMQGVRPAIRQQSTPNNTKQFTLTYKGMANLPGGKTMKRIVRVVADPKGKVIRMSTSR